MWSIHFPEGSDQPPKLDFHIHIHTPFYLWVFHFLPGGHVGHIMRKPKTTIFRDITYDYHRLPLNEATYPEMGILEGPLFFDD
jgi:hypothetical protein